VGKAYGIKCCGGYYVMHVACIIDGKKKENQDCVTVIFSQDFSSKKLLLDKFKDFKLKPYNAPPPFCFRGWNS
jgi:hypothetical protein